MAVAIIMNHELITLLDHMDSILCFCTRLSRGVRVFLLYYFTLPGVCIRFVCVNITTSDTQSRIHSQNRHNPVRFITQVIEFFQFFMLNQNIDLQLSFRSILYYRFVNIVIVVGTWDHSRFLLGILFVSFLCCFSFCLSSFCALCPMFSMTLECLFLKHFRCSLMLIILENLCKNI